MNEAAKEIKSKFEELDINYELTDNKNGIMFELLNEKTGILTNYLIDTMEFKDRTYKLTIFTGNLLKVKNEFEVLKILNNINWQNSFIYYFISEEKQVHIKLESIETLENIANDSIGFISSISENLEKNYDNIMKSNYS